MSGAAAPPGAFAPLPLGAVRPRGWLRRQLRIQADGLSGHLHECWPDVADSAWIGGVGEGWERGPYWLDGIVPLAVLLDDARLLAAAGAWVDHLLAHQRDDGWLGPVHDPAYGYAYDPWPATIALKALAQWAEARPDPCVPAAMARCCAGVAAHVADHPLQMWAQARWADLVLTLQWLDARQPDPARRAFAELLHAQGIDWRALFDAFPHTDKRTMPESAAAGTYLTTHGVNVAMGVRQPAIWWRYSHDDRDRAAARRMLDTLDRHHGQVHGAFSGDEHLAGTSPVQGTELCLVVELLYSLEVCAAILGEAWLGDRLERVAFNALPATFSPDMRAHQYVQQANQVRCGVQPDHGFTDDAPDATVFGLEPHYGCCTANLHQGWPKFAAHLWMRSADGGLAAVAYAPCEVDARAGGAAWHVTVDTDYPFGDTVAITVRTTEPVDAPLHLRVPAWAAGAEITVAGALVLDVAPGSYCGIARRWEGETPILCRFPMRARSERRPGGAVAVTRGPLVYALPLGERWRAFRGPAAFPDYEVEPTTPWTYGLHVAPDAAVDAPVDASAVGACPFSPEGAPVRLRVPGARVPGWTGSGWSAAVPPAVVRECGAPESLTLIPYGCTNLRIAEFPDLP